MTAMLGLGGLPLVSSPTLYYLKSYGVLFGAGILGATPVVKNLAGKVMEKGSGPIWELLYVVAVLLLSTAYLVDGSFSPFLYFRF